MSPMYIWVLLVALIVAVTQATDLAALCSEILTHPSSYRIQLMCDELKSYLRRSQRENELHYNWAPSTRNSRDTSSAEAALHEKQDALLGLRVRRGGNYIRFGRSVSGGPSAQYLKGFGNRDTRGDGHYVRFGRSIPDSPAADDGQTDESKATRFEKRSSDDDMADDKRFMRFGRDPISSDEKMDEEKRFMRFGKKDKAPVSNGDFGGDKRFMRFGKRGDDEMDEKRFMRFGRGGNTADMGDKRFMRFGKRTSVTDIVDPLDYETAGKRFMRFGKRTDTSEMNEDKRFMRFGKRFMRFGKRMESGSNSNPIDSNQFPLSSATEQDKSFIQLHNLVDSHLQPEMETADKRFMRFGKKSSDDEFENEKRFMRFGKRSSDENDEEDE